MTSFNNQAYNALVEDLLNDAFYIGTRSPRGTIATIRQYTEVIVRKILNLSNEDYVTLGNKKILEKIRDRSNNNPLLLNALEEITAIGNKCTHTQNVEKITELDVEKTIENLFNLYAYLFIDYFKKHRFGLNEKVQSAFSILPPIIRYIALSNLFDQDNENISIIDKLSLATLKAFDETKAVAWLEQFKEKFSNMPSVTSDAILDLKAKFGEDVCDIIVSQAPNMYDLCIQRITTVAQTIKAKGRLYDDFESAIGLYKEKGIILDDSNEITEFNNLMEFVYLGRKEKFNERLKHKDSYVTMNNLSLESDS